jgi:DNA replication and repair protein RecF
VILQSLELRNFRNLAHVELTLPGEGIVVIGANGQGKTNLLEAIAYLHLLRSVRGARDADVVQFGADAFTIRAQAGSEVPGSGSGVSTVRERSMILGFERSTRRKRITVDGAVPERLSDALGTLPSVTFAPVDVELVRGGPIERRRYLDVVLATTSRQYLAALQTYRGALLRRNATLRSLGAAAPSQAGKSSALSNQRQEQIDAQLGVWEPILAQSGAALWVERGRWTRLWEPELARISAVIGEREPIAMRHHARLPGAREAIVAEDTEGVRAALAHALEAGRGLDLRHGATRVGPHRDDLLLTLGGRDLRTYASAGQQRTIAIALRILEAATLREEGGAMPVLLLDDPFAELDEHRARSILSVLGGRELGQVVLAVPRASDIPAGLTRLARLGIREGAVTREGAVPEGEPAPSHQRENNGAGHAAA